MKIGIVFQGPLTHKGFDCAENLRRYRERLDRFKDAEVVSCISTWADAIIPSDFDGSGWLVVKNDSVAGYDWMNRQKQVKSTLGGARALADAAAPDFILKIRSDMLLPIEVLLRHVLDLSRMEGWQNRLLFPAANGQLPYFLNDFFFGGATTVLLDFLECNLAFGDVVMRYAPEMDLPLKYLFARHREELSPLTDYQLFLNHFDYPFVETGHLARLDAVVWRRVRDRHFVLTPSPVMNDTVWRGRPLTEQSSIHEAEFYDSGPPPRADFGRPLQRMIPMPWWSFIFHRGISALEYVRWRAGWRMRGVLHGLRDFTWRCNVRLRKRYLEV